MHGMKFISLMPVSNAIQGAALRVAPRVAALAAACVVATGYAQPAFDRCFDSVGEASGIDSTLLRAIAQVESSMRPNAINDSHVQRTGSEDIGLMQINSRWLPRLNAFGIDRDDLLKPCTSIEVGAWILRDLFTRHGNSWEAVGAYNAACTQLKGDDCRRARDTYINKVQRAYLALGRTSSDSRSAFKPPIHAARGHRHVQVSFSTEVVRHTTEVAALTHDTNDTHTKAKEQQ
jgi:soluble lytic murein transglycosylase-like protein